MSQRERKRDRLKKVVKSGGQKVAKFAKSRVVKRFIPLFGLIAIITPGKAVAFTLDDGFKYGTNATFIAAEYRGMREIIGNGIRAIPEPGLRSAVSTTGSIAALVGGVGCGIGTAICTGMGWEQKAMVCLHGVGLCSGIASGMHDADPSNPATVPGKLASDAVASQMV
tara:strand:- start:450 stop:953 length:504 start_codon:yes stop_codon:yes gene_type:complete